MSGSPSEHSVDIVLKIYSSLLPHMDVSSRLSGIPFVPVGPYYKIIFIY